MDLDQYVFSEPYRGWLLAGAAQTLQITIYTSLGALTLGFLAVTFRTTKRRGLRLLARLYITVFRNTPPVPLLLFLVFALPTVFKKLTGQVFPTDTEYVLLVFGLSLNTSAYIAEILRSGLRAVPSEHQHAGQVLGLSDWQIRWHILYPEAVRIALPDLGTRLIHNMKNSTVALVLPLAVEEMEILGQAGRIAGQTFAWAEPLLVVAMVHLTLAFFFGLLMRHLSRRYRHCVGGAP